MIVDRSLEPITAEKSQLEVQREQVIDECLAAQNAAWDECAAGRISFTEWQKRNAEAVFSMHPELRNSSLSSNKVHVLVNGDRVGTENTGGGEAYTDQLYMHPLDIPNQVVVFIQTFPVVASALTMRDNRIIAITPDGERHMVQL